MVEKAIDLCGAAYGYMYTYDGKLIHPVAMRGDPQPREGPRVRISFPPVESPVSRGISPPHVEKPGFSRRYAGRSGQRGRERRAWRGDMTPTGGNGPRSRGGDMEGQRTQLISTLWP